VTSTLVLRLSLHGRGRFQALFHSPRRGAFHRSLTVLCAIGHDQYIALDRGRPSFPPDVSCPVVLERGHALLPGRPTGLSPAAVWRSSHFGGPGSRRCGPCRSRGAGSQPQTRNACTLGTRLVSADPGSLATTTGLLFAPQGTEMFQFPHVPPTKVGRAGCPTRGCPIRTHPARWLTAPPRIFRCWSPSFIG
jgi:hypothetical protein